MVKFACVLLAIVFLPACVTETTDNDPAITDAAVADASELVDAAPEAAADAGPTDAGADGCAPPCVSDTFQIAGRGLATVCHCP